MRGLHSLLLLPLLLLLTPSSLSLPLHRRSAPFPSLTGLTTLTADHSRPARVAHKYFTEATFHAHYDGRFAAAPLASAPERRLHLALLVRSYASFARAAGVPTWIMHGSLLGWWWGRGVLAWDSDVDFCVEERGAAELAAWWNMTVHAYGAGELGVVAGLEGEEEGGGARGMGRRSGGGGGEAHERIPRPDGLGDAAWDAVVRGGKKYLLEVNSHAGDASTRDALNRIDARWIDVHTGLFVDITAVHPVPRPPPAALSSLFSLPSSSSLLSLKPPTPNRPERHQDPDEMYTKDTHLYATASLFPLRTARFEGTHVQVPYAYEQLLLDEYGPRALTETWFAGYRFSKGANKGTGEWVAAAPAQAVEEAGVEQQGELRGGGNTRTGGGSLLADEGAARTTKDNQGGPRYQPRPGRVGDVHVVPGSG
ncbi:hypothetical protein G6514_009043 [Epicoccum nigrum]|nr:hypothetical protein G6514_009043 [Epicoccum nigrum]